MKKAFTLRLSPAQSKQLELIKESMNEATSSKAIFRLISERTQLKLDLESDKEEIRHLKETVYTYKALLKDYSQSLNAISKASATLDSDANYDAIRHMGSPYS